jgi:hypothetical protein
MHIQADLPANYVGKLFTFVAAATEAKSVFVKLYFV